MRPCPVGTRVMRADITEASIPAYRAMRGTVVESNAHSCRVRWDGDREPDSLPRSWNDIAEAT